MDLNVSKLATGQIARYLSTDISLVRYWCRTGKLKATKKGSKWQWVITAADFSEFLYMNPEWLGIYQATNFYGISNMLKTEILENIKSRPSVIDSYELADLLDVTGETIRNWVKENNITVVGKTSARRSILLVESVRKWIKETPKVKNILRDNYTAYYEGRTIGVWPETVDSLYQ